MHSYNPSSLKNLSFTSLATTTKVKIIGINFKKNHHLKCSSFDIKINGMYIFKLKLCSNPQSEENRTLTERYRKIYNCPNSEEFAICFPCSEMMPRKSILDHSKLLVLYPKKV